MKRLIPWLLAALFFQLSIYFYLDRVLFVPAVAKIDTKVLNEGVLPSDGVRLESFDGSYYADITKDWLRIYQANGSEPVKEITIGSTEKLTYFSWLPDRNIALAGVSMPGEKGTICILEPINMVTPDARPFKPNIAGLAKGAEIADVAFSPDINVVYIQVKSGNDSAIYRTDANNHLTQVGNTPARIGRIANLKSEDALLYDSINTGRVYLVDKNGKKQISPADGSQYALLGTDKNDNVYIARLSSAKNGSDGTNGDSSSRTAEAILRGNKSGRFSPLNQSGLPYPVDSIKVSFNGELMF